MSRTPVSPPKQSLTPVMAMEGEMETCDHVDEELVRKTTIRSLKPHARMRRSCCLDRASEKMLKKKGCHTRP